jgi:hypothetical protein
LLKVLHYGIIALHINNMENDNETKWTHNISFKELCIN